MNSETKSLAQPHIKKFYAVITPEAVGIFTVWENASKLICGRRNKQKSFIRYEEARQYLLENMSPEDIADFGLDERKPRFDHVITRRKPSRSIKRY